jgi:hypothetical protein
MSKTATAEKKAAKSKPRAKSSYNDFRARIEAGKTVMIDGRNPGEKKVARRYSLTPEQKAKLIEMAKASGAKTVNPLALRTGINMFQVQALIDLGINQWHSLKDVRDKTRELTKGVPVKVKQGSKVVETNLWESFYHKPAREGAAKPLVGDEKLVQNFRVLQRLPKSGDKHPYGLKLAQFCQSVDIEYRPLAAGQEPVPYIRLNTKWANENDVAPLYSKPGTKRGRKPGSTAPKAPKAVKAAKPVKAAKAAKVTKPKATKPAEPEATVPVVEPPVVSVEPPAPAVVEIPAPAAEAPKVEEPFEEPKAPAPSDDSQELSG